MALYLWNEHQAQDSSVSEDNSNTIDTEMQIRVVYKHLKSWDSQCNGQTNHVNG